MIVISTYVQVSVLPRASAVLLGIFVNLALRFVNLALSFVNFALSFVNLALLGTWGQEFREVGGLGARI